MNNIDYFNYSQENNDSVDDFIKPEGMKVINESKDENPTDLMNSSDSLNELITTYYTLKNMGKKSDDSTIIEVIDEIIYILDKGKLINYSPFCVYFQVLRYSYGSYKENKNKMDVEEKRFLVRYLLDEYLANRYEMYKYHGYSHQILQVMSDASSSRRNSKTGILMLESILNPLGFRIVKDYADLKSTKYCYVESDKGGKKLFKEFLKKDGIAFDFQKTRDNKYPDMLIKIKDDYIILEHKLTNGGGGAQNAEINEIIDFTRYDEQNQKIHYASCLQGGFIKYLAEYSTQPKNSTQRENILNALEHHPNNYFLNGKGLEKLVKDLM